MLRGQRTRCMRRMWVAGLRVDHLLSIPVVRRHAEYVSCLFAGIIDRLHCLVCGPDRFYCSIVHPGVADLTRFVQTRQRAAVEEDLPCRAVRSCTLQSHTGPT